MEPDRSVMGSTRLLLKLPAEAGERFAEEWKIVARRIELVHAFPVSHDTEPAGSPRLERAGE